MNPKYRFVYLLGGVIGLVLLAYLVIESYPFVNASYVFFITISDMAFFYLAYKTYPSEVKVPARSRKHV